MSVQVRPRAPSFEHSIPGCYDAGMSASLPDKPSGLLDHDLVEEIRRIEQVTGRNDVLSGFVRTLENNLAAFSAAFSACIARGDATGATRVAHSLKGGCHQLGARALGDLFAEIERSAQAGDYADAKRRFEAGASLIAESLEALKHA